MQLLTYLLPLTAAALVGGAACAWLRPLALRIGLASVANGDRLGPSGIPLTGGLAVLIGLAAGWAARVAALASTGGAAGALDTVVPLALLMASFAILGHLDDRHDLSARLRFLSESALAAAFVGAWLFWPGESAAAVRAASTGVIAQLSLPLAWAAFAFAVVAGANAYNMCDNSDGLAAGTGAISLAGIFCVRVLWDGTDPVAWTALAAAGALIGFLYWNRPPARVYLGDAGTLPLGALIAWGLMTMPGSAGWEVLLTWPLLVGYLLFDPALAILGRLARRRAPWRGGLDHPAHDLRHALGSWRTAWPAILAVQFFSVATGVAVFMRLLPFGAAAAGAAPWLALAAAAYAGRRMRERNRAHS